MVNDSREIMHVYLANMPLWCCCCLSADVRQVPGTAGEIMGMDSVKITGLILQIFYLVGHVSSLLLLLQSQFVETFNHISFVNTAVVYEPIRILK